MYGIVTLIEGAQADWARGLWAGLTAEFGPEAVAGLNVPHLSYHVANDYDLAAVGERLTHVASRTPSFNVPTSGLGFDGPSCVLWINAVRTPALSALHAAVWAEVEGLGEGVYDRYGEDRWFPNVTLGQHPDLLAATVPQITRLAGGEVPQDLRIDNLAVIEELSHGHEVRFRVALQ